MSCSLCQGTKISGSFPFLEVKEGTGSCVGVGKTVSNSANFAASISFIMFSTSARVYNGSSALVSRFSFLGLSDILIVFQEFFNSSLCFEGTRSNSRILDSRQCRAFQVETTADYNPL